MNPPFPETTRSLPLARRTFLTAAATATASATAAATTGALAHDRGREAVPESVPAPGRSEFIDTQVSMSRWPLRRVPGDEDASALALHLRRRGVTEAWVGSFDGLLHKDLAAVNARLAADCARASIRNLRLRPFGSIHPAAPGWEEDLRRCAEVHRMPGIRLHPNYHGYPLDHPGFAALLHAAAGRGLAVQLCVAMEDERMMHPLLRVPPVDLAPLPDLVRTVPGLRLQLLNALRTVPMVLLQRLLAAGDVVVEIATLEGVGGLARLFSQVPPGRVLFGSHAPLFTFEAAALKLQESPVDPAQVSALRGAHARRFLPC